MIRFFTKRIDSDLVYFSGFISIVYTILTIFGIVETVSSYNDLSCSLNIMIFCDAYNLLLMFWYTIPLYNKYAFSFSQIVKIPGYFCIPINGMIIGYIFVSNCSYKSYYIISSVLYTIQIISMIILAVYEYCRKDTMHEMRAYEGIL